MTLGQLYRKPAFMWTVLLVYSGIIFFINIQSGGIYSAQEGRAAIIARNMIESGDYSRIEIKGEPENEKPIFCYWLCALAGEVFGVNEFSVRLPSVLAALISIMGTAYLAMRIYGQPTGYISGFILATMFGFVNLGRIARIDIVVVAFYVIPMIFLYEGYIRSRKGNAWLYLFYLFMALSVLVKGPVSVFLMALTVFVLIVMEWNFKKSLTMLWELKPISGAIIGLLIFIPWLIFESSRTNENFMMDFFWVQNIDRFLGIQTAFCEGKRKTFLYYIPKLFGMALPWSILVPLLLWQYRKSWRKLRYDTWFVLVWLLTVFIFFSASFIKRGDYILPLFPALAILIGRYVAIEITKTYKITWHWKIVWGILTGAVAIIWFGIIGGWWDRLIEMIITEKIPHLASRDGMAARDFLDVFEYLPWLTLVLAAAALAILWMWGKQLQRGDMVKSLTTFMGILMIIFVFYYTVLDPITGRKRTTKDFCLRIQPLLPKDAVVAYLGEWVDEAVFFVNRDYERLLNAQELFDVDGKFKYTYIICGAKDYNRGINKLEWTKHLKQLDATVPDHHYPLILFKVEKD